MVKEHDVVVIPRHTYGPPHGSFGLRMSPFNVAWFHCREVFHLNVRWQFWLRGFYFSLDKNCRQNLRGFFADVEDLLNIKSRTVIMQTNITNIVYVRPASFWRREAMRFSLFTILCRAGCNYSGDIDESLRKGQYSDVSFWAIKRFLSGYTHYARFFIGGGWANVFSKYCCYKKPSPCKRCERYLESRLVPPWQIFPLYVFFRVGRLISSPPDLWTGKWF